MNGASRSCDGLRHPRPEARLTVMELAGMMDMSPRNIRARPPLPPPVRQGREVDHHAEHMRRLVAIKALQRGRLT